MAATTVKEDKISLKVVVHKEEQRVIFAEADSNFVDTLFSFMTLPMGTIIRLLGKYPDEKFKALGSLTNLYQSLMGLPVNYFFTEESKFMMLNRRSASYDHCRKLKLNIDDTQPKKYFRCRDLKCIMKNLIVYFSTCNIARCSHCGNLMDSEIEFQDSTANTKVASFDGGVFVSDVATFIISDDLRVMPNSSGSITLLLCDFGITDASQLEERTFDIGHKQILNLLQLAFLVKYPLTELVFPCMHDIGYSVNLRQGMSVKHLISNGTGATSKRMMLKVILQKSTSKFLFAEAEEDFVDFVFGFLDIPLGTLIGKLMNGSTSLGCLDNLFASISNMRVGKEIKSQELKDMLLTPQLVQGPLSKNQIFPLNVSNDSRVANGLMLDLRRRFHSYVGSFLKHVELKDPRINGSFLKASAKFMLTNDLVITPFSSLFSIALLNKLEVPVNDIEEHKLSIGMEEGLKFLKASLVSRSTLSDALLNKICPSQDN